MRAPGLWAVGVALAVGTVAAGGWRARASAATAARTAPPVEALRASLQQQAARVREAPRLSNPSAYLPAQCYARTRGAQGGRVHNPCFACHQTPREPNYTDDADVQTTLSVARGAADNRWTNLVRPPAPAALDDAQVLARVRESNYLDAGGRLLLAAALARVPADWDADGDGRWGGYVPDCYFAPDALGFDRAPGGRLTGWRAFAYAPFPGMFWPTNGSAGDVFVRLPEPYRQDAEGRERERVYRVNLAILEAYVRRTDVPLDAPEDERALGSDLDGDGALGVARKVAFVWPPVPGRRFGYVGRAAALDPKRDGWPVAGLYPRGTELLHSVRYLDVQGGRVRMAARMKELRYMRKTRWLTYADLQLAAEDEAREKAKRPNKLKAVLADAERGVGTGTGWRMQGFIEDRRGALRPQSVEETAACIGCHGGVGATTDSTFTLPRKVDGAQAPAGGWYHWGERGFQGIPEPRRADGQGEYAHWLAQVGGGDDYRSNDEVQARFFRRDGSLRPEAVRALARDISTLLVPSSRRALALDRAYLGLVEAQRFERGRDVTVGASPQVEARLEQDGPTGVEAPVAPGWLLPERTAGR